jgi:hypothetical protein
MHGGRNDSLNALQVEYSTHPLAVRHRELPEFGVVIRVDEVEDNVLHVSWLRTQKVGGVEKIESDDLAVGRTRSDHARLISCVTIMVSG